jgi:hypothetical protein
MYKKSKHLIIFCEKLVAVYKGAFFNRFPQYIYFYNNKRINQTNSQIPSHAILLVMWLVFSHYENASKKNEALIMQIILFLFIIQPRINNLALKLKHNGVYD